MSIHTKTYTPNSIQSFLLVLMGALLLMIPAFYNHYPIVNPDDNTYVLSGFLPDTPFDRPITYGLVLWLTSLGGVSLWLAAFFQCLLVSWLLWKVFKRTTDEKRSAVAYITSIAGMSVLTSVSWVAGELIPDVYTSVALLSLFLILLNKERKATKVFLFFSYTIAVATHFSNVTILFALLVLVFLFRKKLFVETAVRKTTGLILLLMLLTVGTIGVMGSALSKSKHVFGVAALLQQGILKIYLDDKCPTESHNLCPVKDNLPKTADEFLWNPNSPVYTTGGWEANKKEYSGIISETITTPKYLQLRAKMSFLFTMAQMHTFGVGDGNYAVNEPFFTTVKKYIPGDSTRFKQSRQFQGTLLNHVRKFNFVIYWVVLVSIPGIIYALVARRKKLGKEIKLFVFLSIALILINVWSCATFAQVNGRYGCRVMWLLPLCALLLFFYRSGTKHSAAQKN